jgi:hypothetical protein
MSSGKLASSTYAIIDDSFGALLFPSMQHQCLFVNILGTDRNLEQRKLVAIVYIFSLFFFFFSRYSLSVNRK